MREMKKSGKAESFRANIIGYSDRSLVQSLTEAYTLLRVKGNYKNV